MSVTDPNLATLQRWFATVVRDPRGATAGARSARAQSLIPMRAARDGLVIKPSPRMPPLARVGVYQDAYETRLVDALRVDFPLLVEALGHADFHRLAAAYVHAHPSHHPNLLFFGRHLPQFIDRRSRLPHRAFLRDLARLELAMVEAFHAPARESTLDSNALTTLSPDQLVTTVFEVSPSLRLVETTYAVGPWLQARIEDRPEPIPQKRQRSHVAVYRKDYRVWRARLSAAAHATLQALASGADFGTALGCAGDDAAQVGAWFQEWTAEGILVGASTPPR